MTISEMIVELSDLSDDLDEFDRAFLESVSERTGNGSQTAALQAGEADGVRTMYGRLCRT